MSETTPKAKSKSKPQSPRDRLKYIVARLNELQDEKARLSEERKTLRAAHRAEKGRTGERGGSRKARGERQATAGSSDGDAEG